MSVFGEPFGEPVSPWLAWSRKLAMFASVTSTASTRVRSSQHLIDLAFEQRDRALADRTTAAMINSLWAIEGMVFRFCSKNDFSVDLCRALPFEAGPAAQCGLSMAAVTRFGFDRGALIPFLEERADERFFRFTIETLGAMMAAYDADFFGWSMAFLARLGLVRRPPLARPEAAAFLADFNSAEQRLIAHGFGRLSYLKAHRFDAMIELTKTHPTYQWDAVLRGAAGAYSIVNVSDLPRVITRWESARGESAAAIRDGLVNTLALLEWVSPGATDGFDLSLATERELIERARSISSDARRQGSAPFLVA